MRILLFITLVLAALATFWCAAAAYANGTQQMETRSELSVFLRQPLTDEAIAIHLSRLDRQARNLAIGGFLSGGAAVLALVCFIRSGRESHDNAA